MDEVTPPVTPEAPAAPAAEPAAPTQPSPEEAAATADANEWDAAAKELFPGLTGKKEPKKDEPAKPAEDGKTAKAGEQNPADEKSDEKSGNGDDAKKEGEEDAGEDESADTSVRDNRLAARQSAQEVEATKSDVREKMFKDVPTELRDADGDPIKTIEDVMKLLNPRTQKPFTEEEAGMWLLSATQQFNNQLANIEKQIGEIADVNVGLKDEADIIKSEYGELLKAMPELREQVWTEYAKTLTKDEKTGLITKAPVSLERFYRMALQPYANMARQMEAQEEAKVAAEAKATAEAETARQQSRADRSDIYSGGKTDLTSADDKEWAEAATAVFGPLKK